MGGGAKLICDLLLNSYTLGSILRLFQSNSANAVMLILIAYEPRHVISTNVAF